MNVEYINPFVESVRSVFETMLDTSPQRQQLRLSTDGAARKEQALTSIIGISGAASGVVALRFPNATALELARRFLASDVTEVNEQVTDALAELANMVGGSAKAKFNIEPPPELSLPTVVEGDDYKMQYPTLSNWVEVPFTSNAGDFMMTVSFGKV